MTHRLLSICALNFLRSLYALRKLKWFVRELTSQKNQVRRFAKFAVPSTSVHTSAICQGLCWESQCQPSTTQYQF